MAKRKTTIYIDDDVITATKMAAVATHRSDSAVIEDALRSYLGTGHAAAAGVDLRAVLDRLAAHSANDLSDAQAIELAVEEVRAVRAERPRGK